MRAPLVLLWLAACGGDQTFVIVKVDQRPSVHGAAKLKVTLSNAGSMRTDELDLKGKAFPVTFSFSAPGRSGDIDVGVDAVDTMGSLVGLGEGKTTVDAMDEPTILLDPADFVVNTTVAKGQFLTDDFEAVGLQLATLSTGVWTAVYRDDCASCDIYGRRFDANGVAVDSALASNSMEFKITTNPTTATSIPAISATGATTIVAWDFFDVGGASQGVACRPLNDQGGSALNQVTISTDSADVVTTTPLSNGNFAVTWQTFAASQVVRGIIVDKNCTPITATLSVSNVPATLAAHRSHVASNQAAVLYAWIVDGDVRVKTGTSSTVSATETVLLGKTATDQIDYVRLAPWGTGFAVAVRWSSIDGAGPGKIEVYRTNAAGQRQGAPILITDKSGSDFASDHSFGIAHRADDSLFVVWHECPSGVGSCDVFGRLLRPTGAPVGDELALATSTGGDQANPSVIAVGDTFVAAWNDGSGLAPDRDGTAVRARVLYPAYDNARGILGAPCGASAADAPTCNTGLSCAGGSDGVMRCYEPCTGTCPHGGTCTTATDGMACTF